VTKQTKETKCWYLKSLLTFQFQNKLFKIQYLPHHRLNVFETTLVHKTKNYLPSSLINLYLKVLKKCSLVLFEQYVKKKGVSKFGGAKCLDFSKKFKELVLFLELAVSLDRGFQKVL
jgi:hypothetical protein